MGSMVEKLVEKFHAPGLKAASERAYHTHPWPRFPIPTRLDFSKADPGPRVKLASRLTLG